MARVSEGFSLEQAVWDAQQAGYAEPDPSLDLDGIDVRAKAQILHNMAFPDADAPLFGPRQAAIALDGSAIQSIVDEGGVPQVVASITPGEIQVRLASLSPFDPLAGQAGSACLRVTTADGDAIVLAGPGAGPQTTARAVLGDLLEVGRRG